MADIAQGTKFNWGGTDIPEIDSFTGPNITHEALDVTDLDSTGQDYLPAGVYDMGEVGLELNYDPDNAVHTQVVADTIAGTERAVIVTWLNGTSATNTWTFQALPTGFTPAGAQSDKLTSSLTLKGTGVVTVA